MTTVSNVSANGLYWEEKDVAEKAEELNKKELGQEDFFALLSQQLAYQDPFKPVDNAQMVAQMASFTTAEGIAEMSQQFENMNSIMSSTQALQASSLVGRNVLIPSEQAYLAEGKAVEGVVVSGSDMQNTTIRIEDDKGNLVKVLDLGNQPAGNVKFSWDGTDESGNVMPPGNYNIKANATVDGQSTDLATANYAHVESVSLAGGSNGVVLNLQGVGSVRLSDVLEVAQESPNVTPPLPGEPDEGEPEEGNPGEGGESVEELAARLKVQLGL
ncbi:flagellar hook assembly protein FlgD [Motilimonas pumila]|uniref:Basal-body rod modification protein FlgD n=1 Tax=Motilimonas pumila TaxID=2303987 RepID=A0A418YGN2_9GAMM|nr:flagellar hook assembly protein FlgD [Motilimonas pumila]RJG48987.1 flagellar hook assembly protein FlgD [Motilimonas pumila]